MRFRGRLLVGVGATLWAVACVRAEPVVVYETVSAYNSIVVTEEGGLRTLAFAHGGARQSVVRVGDPDHIELPYARAMPVGLAAAEARRVLIVGLGGGTLPMFFRRHWPELTIDVVEIDPQVVDVARRFFGYREDDRLQTYVQDGRQFIERCRLPYDVIFLDAYGDNNIPLTLATREFLRAVRRALTPGGLAVANVWSPVSNHLYDSMLRTYQDVFESVSVVDARGSGNQILLAVPRRELLDRENSSPAPGSSRGKRSCGSIWGRSSRRFPPARPARPARRGAHRRRCARKAGRRAEMMRRQHGEQALRKPPSPSCDTSAYSAASARAHREHPTVAGPAGL